MGKAGKFWRRSSRRTSSPKLGDVSRGRRRSSETAAQPAPRHLTICFAAIYRKQEHELFREKELVIAESIMLRYEIATDYFYQKLGMKRLWYTPFFLGGSCHLPTIGSRFVDWDSVARGMLHAGVKHSSFVVPCSKAIAALFAVSP